MLSRSALVRSGPAHSPENSDEKVKAGLSGSHHTPDLRARGAGALDSRVSGARLDRAWPIPNATAKLRRYLWQLDRRHDA